MTEIGRKPPLRRMTSAAYGVTRRLDHQRAPRGLPHTALPATTPSLGGLPEGRSCVRHVPLGKGTLDSWRHGRPQPGVTDYRSSFGVEHSPGHGANLIEKIECGIGSVFVDGACLGKQPEVGVDLFG